MRGVALGGLGGGLGRLALDLHDGFAGFGGGGACRHAGRAIEDCYALNKKADKAAVFAGWRDMNDYMRENKIEPVAPQLAAQLGVGRETASPERPAKESFGGARLRLPIDR